MEKITKIVLTGGPCGGKTTALAKIEEFFTERKIKVFIASESATELIKGGIRPFGDQCFSMVTFQDFILNYQLGKEKVYDMAAQKWNKPCVIVYDRGLMDNKAYISEQEFADLLRRNQLNELDLLDRYDMVIDLVTAANQAEEYYTLENNQSRSEGLEEARILDKRTLNAWIGHRNLVVIDNSTNFEEKMNRVLESIKNYTGYPYSIKYQRKYLVDLTHSDFDFLKHCHVNKMDFIQTYTNREEKEIRLRKRIQNKECTYYYTIKQKNQGMDYIETDKRISESLYLSLLASWPEKNEIRKTRWTFVYQNQYFSMDFFEDGRTLLEVNTTSKEKEVKLPNSLIVTEVTDLEQYNNSMMAKEKDEQLLTLHLKQNIS